MTASSELIDTIMNMSAGPRGSRPLTPRQIRVLDDLIALGATRPVAPPELVDEVRSRIQAGTQGALARWTERSLYVTKSQVLTALRCEGQLVANTSEPRSATTGAMVMGTIAHLAIQLSYTHPDRTVHEYVKQAVLASRKSDEALNNWWLDADPAEQSALVVQLTSRVTNFLDDFPPIKDSWNPRFEEPTVAKVGRLTLSCRPDLVLGRPRGDNKQTLLLMDFKSGDIKDEHTDEARLYALAAALRHGVPPWRSTVYSLASGDYTEPDITPDVLLDTADKLVTAVNSMVDALTETRSPTLAPGPHCRFCPAKTMCAASSTALPAEQGERVLTLA